MKFDLHVHSENSVDSKQSIDEMIRGMKRAGIDGVAICDHNRFTRPPEVPGFTFIPAAEYSTDAGHILTYFLTEPIEDKLVANEKGRYSWRQVVSEAHSQGALCFVAHPYAPYFDRDDDFWKMIDGIEVFNARAELSSRKGANVDAQSTCILNKKPYSCGSDAHFFREIGSTYFEFEGDLRDALIHKRGKVFASCASPLWRPMSHYLKLREKKLYKEIPKVCIRFVIAIFRMFKKRPCGYINMEGLK